MAATVSIQEELSERLDAFATQLNNEEHLLIGEFYSSYWTMYEAISDADFEYNFEEAVEYLKLAYEDFNAKLFALEELPECYTEFLALEEAILQVINNEPIAKATTESGAAEWEPKERYLTNEQIHLENFNPWLGDPAPPVEGSEWVDVLLHGRATPSNKSRARTIVWGWSSKKPRRGNVIGWRLSSNRPKEDYETLTRAAEDIGYTLFYGGRAPDDIPPGAAITVLLGTGARLSTHKESVRWPWRSSGTGGDVIAYKVK